jgi:hypothetical protein
MTPRQILTTLLDRLGVTVPARPRSLGGSGALIAALAIGALAVIVAPALANGGHAFEPPPIGEGSGEGAGHVELVAPVRGIEGTPAVRIAGSGVAVSDVTHDVYVADTGNHRVDEFDADGEFVRAFGANVGGPGVDTCTMILGCGAGATGSAPGELPAPRFVAVDNSTEASDHSKGDVYVGTGVGKEEADELVYLKFNGGVPGTRPSGGTYTLTFEGETTEKLSYVNFDCGSNLQGVSPPGCGERDGEDARSAQQALENLPAIGANHVKVRELPSENSELVYLYVEFVGALADDALPSLTADGSGLAPTGAKLEVSVDREGSKYAGEVVSKFTAEGALVKSWGVEGQLDGSAAEKGPFEGKLEGVAVDPSGDLFVLDEGDVFGFDEAGVSNKATIRLGGETSGSASGIAVDGAGDLYAVNERGELEKYSSTGAPLEVVSASHSPYPTGFALDAATGGVYLGLGSSLEQGAPAEVFGEPQLQGGAGVAVDSSQGEPPLSGAVYAANTASDQVDVFAIALKAETAPATEVKATSMTLNGTVDPEGTEIGRCYFEYGTSTGYGQTAECEPDAAGIGVGTGEVEVHANIKGLQGGTVYHFRLIAVKGAVTVVGKDVTAPATSVLPVVAGEEAPLIDLTATSAQLNATVNPEGIPVTSCRFEYGTGTSYGTVVPCEPAATRIGSGSEPVPVSAAIEGLSSGTEYHWRLSVRDADGEAYASDHVFVYSTAGTELPDGRAYEMVSPVQKNGAALGRTFSGPYVDFAEDGSSVVVPSIQCLPGSESCTAIRDARDGELFDFTRTPTGWVSTDLAPSAAQFSANTPLMSSPETGMALFSMPTPPAGEDDLYARQTDGSFLDIGPVTPPTEPTYLNLGFAQLEATADLSRVVWLAEKKVRWSSLAGGSALGQLLEYAPGHHSEPLAVGVDSEGKPLACTTEAGSTGTVLGSGNGLQESIQNALSADGRTVYFTACGSALYARIDGEEPDIEGVPRKPETVAVSVSACEVARAGYRECEEAAAHVTAPNFQGASTDGSRAFFTDTQRLTDEATQGTGSAGGGGCVAGSDCNLYEFECPNHCENLSERRLIDVSAGDTSGFGPQVRGVVAVSADGSHVYFVAGGVLASGAAPGDNNLYVYERGERYRDGHVAFIAALSGADHENWATEVGHLANVTPDGRFLVFASHGDLTPDDTRSDGAAQIFRYDADETASEEAAHVSQLVRISIGEEGYNDDGNGGTGDAGIPAPGEISKAGPGRGDPTMSNNGEYVFFDSPIALTPHALNDVQSGILDPGGLEEGPEYAENVYEYHEGHVYLISGGRYEGNAAACFIGCLIGSDATGHNVFFETAAQLVPSDTDTQEDIYDARICEAEHNNPCISEPPPPVAPCDGENCHGIPAATPSLLTPGSASFNGEGNVPASKATVKLLTRAQKLADILRTCKKRYSKSKKRRISCEASARKKYGSVKKAKAKKSSTDRRAGR